MMHGGKNTISFKVEVVIEPDEGGFHAYCPALKGLHVSGETEEEAMRNALDAAIANLESLMEYGEPIPVGVVVSEKHCKVPYLPIRRVKHHTEALEVVCATL